MPTAHGHVCGHLLCPGMLGHAGRARLGGRLSSPVRNSGGQCRPAQPPFPSVPGFLLSWTSRVGCRWDNFSPEAASTWLSAFVLRLLGTVKWC